MEATIPKVIRSVSDSFMERSVKCISPVYGTESRYHSLGLEARLLWPDQSKYRSGTV